MPSSTTTIARTEQMASGEQKSVWGTRANRVFRFQEEAFGAVKTVVFATDADKTLTPGTFSTEGEARAAVIHVTGNLSAERNLIFPASQKTYVLSNGTNQIVTAKTAGQNGGVSVPSGRKLDIYCDGNSIFAGANAFNDIAIGENLVIRDRGSDASLELPDDSGLAIRENASNVIRIGRNDDGFGRLVIGDVTIDATTDDLTFTRNSTGETITLSQILTEESLDGTVSLGDDDKIVLRGDDRDGATTLARSGQIIVKGADADYTVDIHNGGIGLNFPEGTRTGDYLHFGRVKASNSSGFEQLGRISISGDDLVFAFGRRSATLTQILDAALEA